MEGGFEQQDLCGSSTDESLMEMGSGPFGCSHYRRRCKIRAPCCDEIFDCRHCHNEAKNSLEVNPVNRHDVPRHELMRVICSLCNAEQDVQQECIQCGVCMGEYFCSECKFFDDDVLKMQYHCDKCGICRVGGKENFFHCDKCGEIMNFLIQWLRVPDFKGCCYSKKLLDSHTCVEKAMHHNCAVCFEFLFDTTKPITVLHCGHTMHLECLREMASHFKYACPVCSKAFCDMSSVWEKFDEEVASSPMPEVYQNKMVWILCNDCGEICEVNFHILGLKCIKCNSYNTRQTQGGRASCSSRMTEMVR